jgi:hypothetical protein
VFRLRTARRFLFRTVSQTVITYRGSALSEGEAGTVHGGDRLPWVLLDPRSGADNFAPLTSLDWQVHVYGDATPATRATCAERHLALHIFPWQDAMTRVGLGRHALYLVRPDGYVALASNEQSVARLTAYLEAWGVRRTQ